MNLAYKYHPIYIHHQVLFNILIILRFLEKIRIRQKKFTFRNRIADLHHFNEDPDAAFYFNAYPDLRPPPNWSTDPQGLHFEPPSPHCERPRPPRIHFQPLKVLNFDLFADTVPAFNLMRIRIRIQFPKIMRIQIRSFD